MPFRIGPGVHSGPGGVVLSLVATQAFYTGGAISQGGQYRCVLPTVSALTEVEDPC